MKLVPLKSSPHNAAVVEHPISLLGNMFPKLNPRVAFLQVVGYLLLKNHISEDDLLEAVVSNRIINRTRK